MIFFKWQILATLISALSLIHSLPYYQQNIQYPTGYMDMNMAQYGNLNTQPLNSVDKNQYYGQFQQQYYPSLSNVQTPLRDESKFCIISLILIFNLNNFSIYTIQAIK